MYRKFFISILFVVFIISLSQILISYILSGKIITREDVILNEHRQIAQNIKVPKILIISGSSTFYGVDTERMSKKLNYPVINFGVSVGLRLDYLFYDAKRSIQDNDIVILPLEYDLYYENEYSESRVLEIWNDKQYFEKQSFIDKVKFLYFIPLKLEFKIMGMYMNILDKDEIIASIMNKEYKQPIDIMNKNGDRIEHIETKEDLITLRKPFIREKVYLDENTKNSIIDFLNYCKEKNVKVFVTYPPYFYNRNYFDGYDLEQINKINDFWQEHDVIILGQYTDFIYTDKNDFYNSFYHLNIKGREKRTEKLIELLRPYINNN